MWGFNVTGPGAGVTAAPRQCMNSLCLQKIYKILHKLVRTKGCNFQNFEEHY
jgi:hypothetical protein